MLFNGERIGNGQPPAADIAVDPIDGTTLTNALANAAALEQLGYAAIEDRIDRAALAFWFDCEPVAPRISYPDVATALARWIYGGCVETVASLSDQLWRETDRGRGSWKMGKVA